MEKKKKKEDDADWWVGERGEGETRKDSTE